jgi:hypothetical protein
MSRIDLPIRSYDLGPSGLTSVQFIRIVGVTGLADQPTNPLFGFNLDAIAAINFASITAAPEPATSRSLASLSPVLDSAAASAPTSHPATSRSPNAD